MEHIYKKIAILVIVIIVGTISYSLKGITPTLSDLAIKNIDVLANGESGEICYWMSISDSYGCIYYTCSPYGTGPRCTCGDTK
jgi:hypothetical protein